MEVDVRVENRFVNIVAEGIDAGIRFVEAIDRDMVHVRLADPGRIVVAAAPSYLKRRGIPQKATDLLQHDCICMRFGTSGESWAWELERGEKTWRVPVRGPVTTNDHELMRILAVAGVGLLYSFEPVIADELARGRLRVVLEQYAPTVPGLFLYFPNRAQASPALRAFVGVARETAEKSDSQFRRRVWRLWRADIIRRAWSTWRFSQEIRARWLKTWNIREDQFQYGGKGAAPFAANTAS